MTTTGKIILIAGLIMALGLAIAVKMVFFPSAKDAYFTSQRTLEHAPAGIVEIRPTHFEHNLRKGVTWAPVGNSRRGPWRVMGRDVSLRDMVAAAYGEIPGRVQLPDDAPTNNFDFIVTTSTPRLNLQKAIRSLGYTAQKETNDTDVLAMKVVDPLLPAFTVSSRDEREDSKYKSGRVYVTHLRIGELSGFFEQCLKMPVVDETSLTNYYDFSVAWNGSMWMRLQNESTARPAVDAMLKEWGLTLEPDTAPIGVLVVKKVY